MAKSERRAATVLLTEEHLRKMIEDHLLKENEVGDGSRSLASCKSCSTPAFPDRPWHDWDDWVKGLNDCCFDT